MAEWKKVVVSGSDISQLNNDANYIADGQSGVSLTGSFSGSFIGDLTGTASYATTTVSSSYALSASYADSSTSASYANTATSASYADNATSASYSDTATSASYADTTTSASYAETSTSASYADTATSASYADTTTSASYATSASYSDTATSASSAESSSYALSSSYADVATSASYAPSVSPFPYTGSAIISGSLEVIGLTTLYNSGSTVLAVSGSTGALFSVSDDVTGDLFTVSSGSIDIFTVSSSGQTTLSGSLTVTNGITASLFGTASYALLALTASYYDEQDPIFTAASGSFVTTSSFNSFTGSYNTGSFTGSFVGDGSGLTGISASVLLASASNGTGISSFTFDGSSNVTVAVSGAAALSSDTITKWTGDAFANTTITDNGSLVTFSTGALFQGDITVQGTASFQNTENLLVADRFVLFASGSNTTGDGGIIVQQGTQNVGELYGYDSGVQRWGFTGSFDASATAYTPEAYIAAVVDVDGGQSDVAKYQKNGNIRISGSDIYIYA